MTDSITWHGHSSFSLSLRDSRIIIDPFLKGNSPVAKTSPDQINVDYVCLSHGHEDHVADALEIAKRCDATIISNFEICTWYQKQGYEKVHPQQIGGGFHHPFAYLKMTSAFHGSMLPDGSYGGMPGGFLFQSDKTVYFSGDTGLFSDMSLIGDSGIDVALVCVGDNFTMGPDDSIRAINFLRPKVVIPCHYDTFEYIKVDIGEWKSRVEAETNAKAIILNIDEKYEIKE